MNGVLCLLPTPARTGFGGGRPAALAGGSETGRGSTKPGETLSISVWRVRVRSPFGSFCIILCNNKLFWPPRPQCGCCRSRPVRGAGSSSGAETHGWRRASPPTRYCIRVPPGVQNGTFLVNAVEIPTTYFLLANQSYRPLAAQMVVLMTLTRTFVVLSM